MTNIEVIVKESENPGMNVVVLAGVHGNESFGVEMLKKTIPKIKVLNGKVTFIFANLEALKQNKRFVEYNLNRAFFKTQSKEIYNTLEGKTDREIMPYLDEADVMLDIHASFTPESIPFIICQPQSFEFAKCLPFEIVSSNWDNFEPGSTDYYMNIQNKIGICIECGFMNDKKSIKRARRALFNFLTKTQVIKGQTISLPKKKFFKIISLYKNKFGVFKKSRDFSDFEKLKESTLIGKDGPKEVYVKKAQLVLFVRDCNDLGDECFLAAEETLLNSKKLSQINKIKRREYEKNKNTLCLQA